MKHILLIEDEADMLRSMRYMLARKGYRVSTAENGSAGLELITESLRAQHPLDLIITDIMMPGLSGLEVIRQLRLRNRTIPVLAITGHGDKDMVVQLMQYGCQYYLDKPFTPQILLAQVTKIFEATENQQNNAAPPQPDAHENGNAREHQLRLSRSRLKQYNTQFQAAKGAYESLTNLKNECSGDLFSWRSRPLHELGGDFVDIQQTANRTDILLADVSGHDMGASYHTVLLKAFFSTNAILGNDGPTFFELVNRQLLDTDNTRMITAVFIRLDLVQMKGEVVCAGHPPLIEMRKKVPVPRSFHMTGDVLGILETVTFEKQEFNLHPGDRYFIHTDGVTDVSYMDPKSMKKHKLTDSGLDRLLEKHYANDLNHMIQAVWDETLEFCRYKPNDDMMLLGVEIPDREANHV